MEERKEKEIELKEELRRIEEEEELKRLDKLREDAKFIMIEDTPQISSLTNNNYITDPHIHVFGPGPPDNNLNHSMPDTDTIHPQHKVNALNVSPIYIYIYIYIIRRKIQEMMFIIKIISH